MEHTMRQVDGRFRIKSLVYEGTVGLKTGEDSIATHITISIVRFGVQKA